MGESYKHNIEWKKSFIIEYILYDSVYLMLKIKLSIIYGCATK